tara:strand:+ start:71 stop:757 length:687 start_codon:yes stop_codon:yes gene_type:complete
MNEMNSGGNIIPLFPIPVAKININRKFTKEELQLCLTDIPMYRDKEQGMSNHRSEDAYLFDNFAEELKDIKSFCKHELLRYLKEIEGADTNLAGLRITQSWLNLTKPQESHHPHTHPNSYLSGVLYIKCLPNDHIVFRNRSHRMYNNMEFPKKKETQTNSLNIGQVITEGDLIIFPSWVPHYVDLNETKYHERISLSFNSFPTGEMGNYDGATHLKFPKLTAVLATRI